MTKLDYARKFFEKGISVIPLHHRNKRPDASLIGGKWERYITTSNTEYELLTWLGGDWRNYGVVCGWHGLVVIDFDNIEYFEIWKLWTRTQNTFTQYVADHAFKVKTARGVHVYVTTIEPECNRKRIGIDIQAQRKYVVGPGSVHPSGHVYEPMTHDFVFPVALCGVDEILPLELFPLVIPEVETGAMPPAPIQHSNTEYDAFTAASYASGDLDLITKVKASVRIESLFHNVRKTSNDGRWLVTLCPFHQDHNPSMWIDARRQICGCQTCGFKPMDCINLYSRMHNLSESIAVVELAKECGVWG